MQWDSWLRIHSVRYILLDTPRFFHLTMSRVKPASYVELLQQDVLVNYYPDIQPHMHAQTACHWTRCQCQLKATLTCM